MNKLRVIQIGVGSWGFSWIEKILASDGIELVGVIDINDKVLEIVSERYGLNSSICFRSLKEAVESVKADAALIIVPPHLHKAVTIEALNFGLHCLIEKPLAEEMSDAIEMVNTAEKVNKIIMVSQNYRFKRAPQTVKNVIERKFLGEIGTVYINFQKSPKFTGFRTEMFEPLITDMSVHHFDQIRGILQLNPIRIKATSWNTKWSWFKGNPVASVLFEMDNGAFISYNGSWVSRGWETTWDGDWRIQGENGEIHWTDNKVILSPNDIFLSVFQDGAIEQNGKLVFDLVKMENEERMATISEFVSSIKENRQPETSGKDNLYSLAMVLGAKYAAKTGETVEVSQLFDSKYYDKFSHYK
jgi:predicted dehydrogenase